MPMSTPPPVPEPLSRTIETLYRSESGRVLATLVRLLGDLDLAEESMHEAFAAALESRTLADIPDKPRPWLVALYNQLVRIQPSPVVHLKSRRGHCNERWSRGRSDPYRRGDGAWRIDK